MRGACACAALKVIVAPVSAQEPGTERLDVFTPSYVEFFGQVELEGTGFAESARFDGQTRDDISIAARPSLLMEWADGDVALTVTPFLRYDAADDARTHFDLREAKVDLLRGDWAFTLGNDFVFWGRTEAVQLVDIINSDDAVESIDLEEKLGQPMLRATRFSDVGTFSAYWMPYFRVPTFAGEGGRLRGASPVDDDDPRFEVSGDEWAQSFALRWEHAVGDYDLGVHSFYGVSRDAALEPDPEDIGPNGPTELRPVFDEIFQIGFDGQYTSGPALWKLEALTRFNQLDRNLDNTDYVAATAGLEYTFFGVAETAADVGVLLEAAYDSRGEDALTPFEEDVILGLRLTLNDPEDTAFLLTNSTDVRSGATALRVEAERRVFDSWKVELEGQAFLNAHPDEIESDLQDDHFLRARLIYFW